MESIIRMVATKINCSTYMGSLGEFPRPCGNYFTLKMHDDKYAWVQNITAENLEEICKRKNIHSIEILYLPKENKCFVIDDRIPRNWFRTYDTKQHPEEDYDKTGYFYMPYIPKFKNFTFSKDGEKYVIEYYLGMNSND